MFNLKLSIYGALFGLIISIFFGLVGGIQFGVILLRALISALLCGGILALASFLFKRFLSDSLSDLSSDSYTPVPGGIVDITVDEDVLPDSDNAPDFYISKKYGENQSVQTNESKSIEKVGSVETFQKEKSNDVFESEEKVSENDTHQFVQTPLAKEKYVSSDGSESGLESLDSLPEFGTVIDYYYPSETVKYDKVLTGTYVWISYISYNGIRRYICIGKKGSNLNGYNV